jgi:putative protein kinase ArgK-like GTPase of G3E family
MLDVADIVVVNKTDLERAKAALSEIEHRLTQNKRAQQIVATVAKRHRDAGVDKLYELITRAEGEAPVRRGNHDGTAVSDRPSSRRRSASALPVAKRRSK